VKKLTIWNAPEIVKTNNLNYREMISRKGLHRYFFKDHVKFEMQCLDRFLVMFDDQIFLVDGNEVLESE
jgi:hypothetical protein